MSLDDLHVPPAEPSAPDLLAAFRSCEELLARVQADLEALDRVFAAPPAVPEAPAT